MAKKKTEYQKGYDAGYLQARKEYFERVEQWKDEGANALKSALRTLLGVKDPPERDDYF
jgi:hypothetical protein